MGRCSRAPAAAGGPSWRSGRWWQQLKTRRGRSLFAAAGCRRNLGAPPPQVEGWGWGVRRDPATSAAPVPLRSPPAPVPASPGLPRSRFTAPRRAGCAAGRRSRWNEPSRGPTLPAPRVAPRLTPPPLSVSESARSRPISAFLYLPPWPRLCPSCQGRPLPQLQGLNQVTRKRTGRRAGAHALHVATARGPAARPGPRRGPPLPRSPAGGGGGARPRRPNFPQQPWGPPDPGGRERRPRAGPDWGPVEPASEPGARSPPSSPRDPREPGWGCAQRARRPYLRPWRDQPGCAPPAPPAAVGPGSAFAGGSGFLVPAAPRVNH